MSENKQYRHAKRAEVEDNEVEYVEEVPKKQTRKTTKKVSKKKKTFKFKPIYIIPIIFLICCIGFGVYIYSSTKTDGPVYGQRCSGGLAIEEAKIEEARNQIVADENIDSVAISVNCLSVKMEFKFVSGVSIDTAKEAANNATYLLDNTLGYDKNSEEDSYSRLFSMDGDRRQYDIEITLYGDQEGYPVFGTKQYKSSEITYTDANVKDQSVVDSVMASQETEEE